MPSNHKMIDIVRYVGGETGWVCDGEIKATAATADQIRRALQDCGEPYARQMARMYSRNVRHELRMRAEFERWEQRRGRYLMMALRRKTER